jgi:hypothetical protein
MNNIIGTPYHDVGAGKRTMENGVFAFANQIPFVFG